MCTLIQQAKNDGAAIVIPNYLSSSGKSSFGNSALIQSALEDTDFDGPVINVSLEQQTAFDQATYHKKYRFGDSYYDTGVLLKRTTHSFQVQGTTSFSRIAARLVNAISGGYRQTDGGSLGGMMAAVKQMCIPLRECVPSESSNAEDDAQQQQEVPFDFAERHAVVAVVAGGGAAVLEHIAEVVREKIPLIVLSGSGRLCNFLPAVYLKRFSPGFNVYQESLQFCKECGFEKDQALFGRWVRTIVQDGNVKIHELKKSQFALKRILLSVEHDDEALKLARRRYAEYTLAAESIESPKALLLYMKVTLSFIITLLSTVLRVGTGNAVAATPGNQTAIPTAAQADAVAGDTGAQVATVVLPIVLSVIMSIQQDFNYGPKQLALRYGAALVESETYRYRTRTNAYSDEYISKAKAQNDGEEANVSFDTLSERTQKLSKELIRIAACVATFARAGEEELSKRLREAAKESSGKIHKNLAVERSPSEYRFGILNGDEYLARAMKEGSAFEARADRLSRLLTVYKILTYCVGALGSVFALINLEVCPSHCLNFSSSHT